MWLIASLTIALASMQAARIPFEPGVTLTYAAAITGKPDWESRVSVASRDASGVTLQNNWSSKQNDGTIRWYSAQRQLPDAYRRAARSFHVYASTRNDGDFTGSSYHMPSIAVWSELKRTGKAQVAFLAPEISGVPYTGVLTRAGDNESVEVLVNGRLTTLRGIRAAGMLHNPASPQPETHFSFVFLDDSIAPWILVADVRNAAGSGKRQVVQIRYGVRLSVEADLTASCRATEYGIHFASGSAELDSAARPAIAGIADALQKHPQWRLSIVGHTDSIGAAAANLDLAQRRAERVRLTLVRDHAISAPRLSAEGKGEQQPIADNGTLTGRARNRRVELIRDCR